MHGLTHDMEHGLGQGYQVLGRGCLYVHSLMGKLFYLLSTQTYFNIILLIYYYVHVLVI